MAAPRNPGRAPASTPRPCPPRRGRNSASGWSARPAHWSRATAARHTNPGTADSVAAAPHREAPPPAPPEPPRQANQPYHLTDLERMFYIKSWHEPRHLARNRTTNRTLGGTDVPVRRGPKGRPTGTADILSARPPKGRPRMPRTPVAVVTPRRPS